MFIKYQLLRCTNDKDKHTLNFHDKWDALVKNNYIALQQLPGIAYRNSR